MSRESFLSRVRQAAESGRRWRITHQDLPIETGYVGASGDLCARLAAEICEVGGFGEVVESIDAARSSVIELLSRYEVKRAASWQHPVLDRIAVRQLLSERGIGYDDYESLRTRSADDLRTILLSADIGISGVDFAIAETGTLVVCARPGQERSASLIAPVHIAVVESVQIVPDLIDAISRVRAGDGSLPSNIALITGPSKTGDIELQLTTGVHGPGKWHVIIIGGS